MSRHYTPMRLSPDAAGKLQHSFNRLQADHTELQAELAALKQTIRASYGVHAWLELRNTARNKAKVALLKQEIAA